MSHSKHRLFQSLQKVPCTYQPVEDHGSDLYHCRLVWIMHKLDLDKVISYMLFLYLASLRCSFLKNLSCCFHQKCDPLFFPSLFGTEIFIHSPIGGYFCCFQFLATMNKAAINILHKILCACVFSFVLSNHPGVSMKQYYHCSFNFQFPGHKMWNTS